MKREETDVRRFLLKGKRVLASTLALAMVLSTDAWAGMNGIFASKATSATSQKVGDVNGDGSANLNDTLIILKHAVGVVTLKGDEFNAADIDGNGKVDLEDTLYSLKLAVGIDFDLPSNGPTFTPYVPPEDDLTPATATPKTTFEAVTANALSVVEGKDVSVAEDSAEYSTAFVENYNGNEGMYAFYDNEEGKEENGIKIENPIAGRRDLFETVASATSLEAEEGKVNVWTLTGASLEALPAGSVYPSDADPRVTTQFKKDEVTYTIPEWSTGLTVSFWAKVNQTSKNADPLLTFSNDNMILSIRANGSVKLTDSTDSGNTFNMGSSSIEPLGTGGEWNYYTITIANDWIGVYVNGQENVYDTTSLMRSKMKTFNGGFMTRINPISVLTQEDIDNATDKEYYYYTKTDSISTLLLPRAGWYKNPETGEYEGFDEFDIFDNSRFRGANGNGTFIMDFLTSKNTMMFLGGMETSGSTNVSNLFKGGALLSDVKFYDTELTAEQIASNYEYIAKASKPSEDIAYAGENPNSGVVDTPTETPDAVVTGGALIALKNKGLGDYATYDKESNTYTFLKAEERFDDDGEALELTGVRLENPFAAVKNGDDKSYLKETLEEALEGQTIFPYKYPDDYEDSELAGKFVAKSQNNDAWTGHGGCDRFAIEVHYGNFYDKYYGDVYKYGNEMTTKTGDLEKGTILTEEEVKTAYKDEVTEYQRPEWSNGVSLSFWAKPELVDDSPLITFYSPDRMLLTVDTMGSVCFMSLYDDPINNGGDWKTGKALKANGEPRNTFVTYGDSSYVKEGEWNYYTVTFANDWIQVYVNGVEMVYKKVNLNRNETKYFNMNYMTRYNPIGIWTNEMVEKYGDPSGVTKEGTERNYLTKSGYVWDLSAGLEIAGVNKSADSAALRANNVYENPLAGHDGSELLMTLMTENKARLYIGGISNGLKATEEFTFSTLYVPMEDMGVENIRVKPIVYVQTPVLQGTAAAQSPIYVDADVIAVDKDTEGAVLLEGIKDYEGNDIYVSAKCNVVTDVTLVDGKLPTGVYELKRNTDEENTAAGSRKKIYSSDHTLAEGTQVKDVKSYYVELSADEVAEEYKAALAEMTE